MGKKSNLSKGRLYMARTALIVSVITMAALLVLSGVHSSAAWAQAGPSASDASTGNDSTSTGDLVEDLESLDDLQLDEDLEKEVPPAESAWDPLIGWNRGVYRFNDRLYYWVLKPVSQAYREVVPLPARTGVKNFFYNLAMPIRFVNCVLQLKFHNATAEIARFFFNSTRGILGFGDPARDYPELNPPPEDTGQTLGYWGIGPGPYIVWPFLGPSTLRDSFGIAGDYVLYPVSYSRSIFFSVGVSLYSIVNQTSLVIGEYEAIQKAAIDPYIAIREAFVDNRKKLAAE